MFLHQLGSIMIGLPQPRPRSFSATSESCPSSPTPPMRSRYRHCVSITSAAGFASPCSIFDNSRCLAVGVNFGM